MSTPSDQVQDVLRDALALISLGKKNEAIQLLRKRFGLGLQEAKEMADGLERGRSTEFQVTFQPTIALTSDREAEARQLLASGNKIQAIKLIREMTGLGLKEAKDAADAMEAGRPFTLAQPIAAATSTATTPAAPLAQADAWAEIDRLMRSGNKIGAIKRHREAFGTGLAEAKQAVEMRAVGQAIPQAPRPPQTEEPQTLAQRLGIPGVVVGLVGVLIVLTMCALLSYAVWNALAG